MNSKHLAMALLMFACAAGGRSAWADEPVPMSLLLEKVAKEIPGRVLKVELEEDHDSPSGQKYEVKILREDGRVVEMELDAVSLDVLEVEEGHDWFHRKKGHKSHQEDD
ncbi:hypothetical protein JCM17960_15050 [Magnetospira thiophila]